MRVLGNALVRFCLLIAFAVAGFPSLAFAATINVPADKPTIQAGINAASNGDTVLVAPGTYYENIRFYGKAIVVTSSGGPGVTTIDGGSKGGLATVVFADGETNNSVISNFTIRGGGDAAFSGTSDGGIYVTESSPVIQHNIVTANYCHDIDVEFGTALIVNNEISGVLQDTQGVQGESYCSFGSGINLQGTPNPPPSSSSLIPGTRVVGNTIENNLTGSGINLWAAQNVLIRNNLLRNNVSAAPGSAVTSANSAGTVLFQNLIYGNSSACGGALAFMDGGSSVKQSHHTHRE